MLQKFKITTCAFILCLFGVTLTTVSPVLAEDSKEFKECQLIKPKDTDLALMKQKKDCFRDLARVLSAGGTDQETLHEDESKQRDKISDLEGKLANALVSIMVSESLMAFSTSHIATLQIANTKISDLEGRRADYDRMLGERHDSIIEQMNLVDVCRKEYDSAMDGVYECGNTVSELKTVLNTSIKYTNNEKKELNTEIIRLQGTIVDLEAKMLKDAALYDDAVRLYKEQQALLTEANTKIIDLDSEVKTREDVQLKTNEVYADVKEKLTAANTKLSALCNHEALAHVRNVKGLLANAEIRRLCNE